jgi:hypothetical protein
MHGNRLIVDHLCINHGRYVNQSKTGLCANAKIRVLQPRHRNTRVKREQALNCVRHSCARIDLFFLVFVSHILDYSILRQTIPLIEQTKTRLLSQDRCYNATLIPFELYNAAINQSNSFGSAREEGHVWCSYSSQLPPIHTKIALSGKTLRSVLSP